MKSVIIATENMGKFREITSLLDGVFDQFFSLRDFQEKIPIEEDSDLYVENAIKKARKIGDRFGMHALADDSGLEVTALEGRPGVRSARYGKNDDERIEKLLKELEGVPWDQRGAVFKAYLSFYMPERERCYVFYGELRGFIGTDKHGHNGFGFDPVFYVPELDAYLAEISMDVKNRLSHRGRAIQAFINFYHE